MPRPRHLTKGVFPPVALVQRHAGGPAVPSCEGQPRRQIAHHDAHAASVPLCAVLCIHMGIHMGGDMRLQQPGLGCHIVVQKHEQLTSRVSRAGIAPARRTWPRLRIHTQIILPFHRRMLPGVRHVLACHDNHLIAVGRQRLVCQVG